MSPHLPTVCSGGGEWLLSTPLAAGGRQLLTAPQCPRGPFLVCVLRPHKPANARASAVGPHRPGGALGSGSRASYRAVVPWGGSPRLLSSGKWSTLRFTSDWRAGERLGGPDARTEKPIADSVEREAKAMWGGPIRASCCCPKTLPQQDSCHFHPGSPRNWRG